nr:hypothetical protein [uncultured Desulfobacter sp.]
MNYMEIDWNKVWAEETELWNKSAGKPCQGFWEDKKSAEVFESMDSAVSFYARRFRILSPEHRPIVEAYLEEHCKKDDRGLVDEFSHMIMELSWRPGDFGCSYTQGEKR